MTNKNKQNPKMHFQNEKGSFTIIDIILVLARHFKIIILTPSILCIIAIIYVLFIAKPIYLSSSRIMSSNSGASISQAMGLAAQLGINISGEQNDPNWSYLDILKSRTVARRVLDRNFYSHEFGVQKSLFSILTNGDQGSQFTLEELRSLAVTDLVEIVSVEQDMRTSIITMQIEAQEAILARDINLAFIEELDAFQRQYNKTKTGETRKFIEERIIDTQKELVEAEENLKVFMGRNRRMENSPALQLEMERLQREVEVLTSVFTTLKQQLETVKIEEVKESDYVIIIEPPEIPIYYSRPKKRSVVFLAGIIGIILGAIIGFFLEFFKNSKKEHGYKLQEIKMLLTNNLNGLVPFKKDLF